MFLGPSGSLEAWGTKAEKRHIFQKRIIGSRCRRRRQGEKTIRFCNMFVFGPWHLIKKRRLAKQTLRHPSDGKITANTRCYAIALTGRKSGFRAGFRPAGGLILRLSRLESGRNPARKPDSRPGSTMHYLFPRNSTPTKLHVMM